MIKCSKNYAAGEQYQNPGISDFQYVRLDSMDACIQKCADFNTNLPDWVHDYKYACTGVNFQQGYCYLKNGVTPQAKSLSDKQGDSAILYLAEPQPALPSWANSLKTSLFIELFDNCIFFMIHSCFFIGDRWCMLSI